MKRQHWPVSSLLGPIAEIIQSRTPLFTRGVFWQLAFQTRLPVEAAVRADKQAKADAACRSTG
jgi:hypothetical protein